MERSFFISDYYAAEDLIPIVAALARKYTSGESTSLPYERVRVLRDAAVYCIRHFFDASGNESLIPENIPAKEAYRQGYDIVCRKVKDTLLRYNSFRETYYHYGNIAYRETVEKGLPAFFLYYDPMFAPTETIITMDYPVLELDVSLEGIDRIAQYVDLLFEEHRYLQRYPKNFVIDELRTFHPQYEKEIFNLREIVERQGL